MTVSKIRVRLPTRFPSSVSATSPIVLSTVGGAFTFSLDQSALLTSFNKTGTGTTFVMQTSPTLITPILGVATATSINAITITAPAAGATLTIPDGVTLTGPAASGTAMTLGNTETVTGVKTFGSAGAVGRLKVAGTTSGTTVVDATAVASGTLTLPAATDTLVGKATTDILTNKTYDTAGTGNVFKINGTTISANTGTGSNVLATSPTITTPNIVGSATNDSAATGSVGEILSATLLTGSAISLTTATTSNIASITLSAGDWDIDAIAYYTGNAATTVTGFRSSISTTNATENIVAPNFNSAGFASYTAFAVNDYGLAIPPFRVSLSGSQQYWLTGRSVFATNTCSAYGHLRARRVR